MLDAHDQRILDGMMSSLLEGKNSNIKYRCLWCDDWQGNRLQICSGCKSARFCSDKCAKEAWPVHRHICSRLQTLIRSEFIVDLPKYFDFDVKDYSVLLRDRNNNYVRDEYGRIQKMIVGREVILPQKITKRVARVHSSSLL